MQIETGFFSNLLPVKDVTQRQPFFYNQMLVANRHFEKSIFKKDYWFEEVDYFQSSTSKGCNVMAIFSND